MQKRRMEENLRGFEIPSKKGGGWTGSHLSQNFGSFPQFEGENEKVFENTTYSDIIASLLLQLRYFCPAKKSGLSIKEWVDDQLFSTQTTTSWTQQESSRFF